MSTTCGHVYVPMCMYQRTGRLRPDLLARPLDTKDVSDHRKTSAAFEMKADGLVTAYRDLRTENLYITK